MKRSFFASITGIFIVVSLAFTGINSFPEHKVNINLEDSKIQWTAKSDGERAGIARLTGGELVLENNEIKGGSITIDLNSTSNKDSRARFEIKKVTKLPVIRTEQGDIKFTHKIEGELTMKGETKTISFDASVNMLKGKVAASSEPFRIDNNTSLTLDLVTD